MIRFFFVNITVHIRNTIYIERLPAFQFQLKYSRPNLIYMKIFLVNEIFRILWYPAESKRTCLIELFRV